MSEGHIPLSGDPGAAPDPVEPDDDGEIEFVAEDADFGAVGFVADKGMDAAGFVADKGIDAASWTGEKFKRLLGLLVRSLGVVFLPIPFPGLAKKQLAFTKPKKGALRFVPQQRLVATAHVIWIGWLVGAGTLYNHLVDDPKNHLSESVINGLEWAWIVAICLTVLMLGLDFGRVAFGFLLAVILVLVLSVLLYEQVGEVEIVKQSVESLKQVDVELGWGVPIIVSGVLGISLMISSTWQQLDDQWEVAHQGNFLEHENFAAKDLTIQKGAKTFIHSWPCLVKRLLLFGYGEIEVRDSRGQTMIAEIKGVMWAMTVSNELKKRFETTDIAMIEEEEEEQG